MSLRTKTIKTAEKQVPKKPKEQKLLCYWDGKEQHYAYGYVCPNCEAKIVKEKRHCHKCGQTLDWSDVGVISKGSMRELTNVLEERV